MPFQFYHQHQNIDVSEYLYVTNASDLSMSIASCGGCVSFATTDTSSFKVVLRVSSLGCTLRSRANEAYMQEVSGGLVVRRKSG